MHSLSIALLIVYLTSFTDSLTRSPYEVLEINKRASITEIKKAYKRLAKLWHPDKSSDPNAESRFVELNEAYELLSDPARRDKFDRYGIFDAGSPRVDNPYDDMFHSSFDPFHFSFPFGSKQRDASHSFNQHRVTFRMFKNNLVPQSFERPYLIFVYADMCLSCMQVEDIWERQAADLESSGYGIGTVNINIEQSLASELRIRTLPTIAAVVDGRVYHYRYNTISERFIKQFARNMIPTHVMLELSDATGYELFLTSAIRLSKVPILMISSQDLPRLQYLVAAMKFQTHASFAFVRLAVANSELKSYRLTDAGNRTTGELLLAFNERLRKPVAKLQAKELLAEQIFNFVNNNKYMILPRLSSQRHLEDICLPESIRSRKRLCVILMLTGDSADAIQTDGFLDYVEGKGNEKGSKVRYATMSAKQQTEFIEALRSTANSNHEQVDVSRMREVLILWRLDKHVSRFSWLSGGWSSYPELINKSITTLDEKIQCILNDSVVMTAKSISTKELQNEHAPGWYKRLAVRMRRMWETLVFTLESEEILPAISVIGTLFAILGFGYCLNYMNVLEQRDQLSEKKTSGKAVPVEQSTEFEQLVRELRAETYFGMVRLLKPGSRSLVLLCDTSCKDALLKRFTKIVWPWRKNKALLFGWVNLDKNLEWYRALLNLALPEAGELKINAHNVVGTVLALNGFRRYFNIYHAKHPASMKHYVKKQLKRRDQDEAGSFLGFAAASQSSDEESEENNSDSEETNRRRLRQCFRNGSINSTDSKSVLLCEEELLDGLGIWLDKLFDGSKSVTRYYIPEWPAIR